MVFIKECHSWNSELLCNTIVLIVGLRTLILFSETEFFCYISYIKIKNVKFEQIHVQIIRILDRYSIGTVKSSKYFFLS